MLALWERSWEWYESQRGWHAALTAILLSWQLVHLYWLTTTIVIPRLTGVVVFSPGSFLESLLIVVDYVEIPALITTSIFYLHQLRKGVTRKPLLFLVLINSQWLHLLWITDEFVLNQLTSMSVGLPLWLAWLAMSIDYLELPVMFDMLRQVTGSARQKIAAAWR